MQTKLNFATRCIHAGQKPEAQTGAIMTPIFQTSTFVQESPAQHRGFEYSRSQNPTRLALEQNLASLENARHALSFSSGCAATNIILMSLQPGDHVIAIDDLYGGTRRLFEQVFAPFGISFDFTDLSKWENISHIIKSNTKLIWLETPTNPLLKLANIEKISNLAHNKNIKVVVDNTFATPYLQSPLNLGADLVIHSTTKYIGGHSDIIGGAIMTNNTQWFEKLAFLSNSIGAVPAPLDCFLTLRGIKTLKIRMDTHCKNAQILAQELESYAQVSQVFFPGLPTHPNFQLAQQQMKGPSGIISIILKDGLAKARQVCEKTRLFLCAESLGGVESLIEHPSSMTHASVSPSVRRSLGIDDGLVRLSVGVEDVEDLKSDLFQAICLDA